ncbi:MAG TPA: type II toxin-antitoxin system RelE/ParE family toxin [Alphaproteobacteria bacterium]|jgi:mRNA interferase RelE/StbE|nr:type II toxin-antitoxin system RelE/ParE family toxin [Alphaproteobacteria bacterium]
MYKIELTSEAKSQLKKLKLNHKLAVDLVMQDLKEDPYASKSLERNLSSRFSYRIGVYRIIYKIDEEAKLVTILIIGHRSTVYN